MSRRGKPFAQYSTVLPDGRFVVEVRVFDPFLVTVVLVATSGRGALEQVRAIGGRDVHVSKDFRPDREAVAALLSGELRGVFAPEPSDGIWLPLTELPAFLDGTSRHLARYDVRAFDRSWARSAGDAR